MITFKGVIGIIDDELSSIYNIDKRQHFRSITTLYCLIKRVSYDKGFRAVVTYRFKNYAYLTKKKRLLTFLRLIDGLINGIDIAHGAEIGPGLYLPHAQCIVIGNAVIGNNVTIYPGVTIGATWGKTKEGKQYATVGDGVKISTGAKIVGPVSVGKNSIIGANAVVVNDIPEDSVAVGIPAKVTRRLHSEDTAARDPYRKSAE